MSIGSPAFRCPSHFLRKRAGYCILRARLRLDRIGAMNWAAGSPNLLNVAVTRAKKHCYIIGDKGLWGRLPFFQTALQEYAKVNRADHAKELDGDR